MRILIVTYNWPPRNAVGVHRPYAWAKYWSSIGESVQVLTAKKYGFDEPLDMRLAPLPNVEVIEVDYLKRASFLDSIFKLIYLRRALKKVKNWLNLRSNVSFDIRGGWRSSCKVILPNLAEEIDVVVSTFGPAASHLIAFDLKKMNPRIKWIADYRDLWSNGHLANISSKQREIARSVEVDSVGRHADAVTSVSDDLLVQLQDLLGLDGAVMPNGFDGCFNKKSASKGDIDGYRKCMKIVYTGMIYRGHRDPVPLLEALERLVDTGMLPVGAVSIEFYGSRNEVAEELAENKRWSSFIKIMGHVDRDAAIVAQRSADLLLLLESPEPIARGVVPAKVYEYIFSGVPILSLGSAFDSEIVSLLNETGTGLACGNDIERICKAVSDFYQGNMQASWYVPNLDKINYFTRERQSLRMLSYIKSISTQS